MNLLFKLSYLNSNFALTLSYVDPDINLPFTRAQAIIWATGYCTKFL